MTAMVWNRWGAPEGKKELSPEIRSLLKSVLGISGDVYEPIAPEDVQLRESTLDASHLSGLAGLVGSEHVSVEHNDRLLHAGGKSTLDLLRRRSVGIQDAPDAIVSPGDHSEVVAVLEYCASAGIAVVPFGGGTSVVGGVQPDRGTFASVVTLDLTRLVTVATVDEIERHRDARSRAVRPGRRGATGRAGLVDRPPAAELPVREYRRFRGNAIVGSGVGWIRPLR